VAQAQTSRAARSLESLAQAATAINENQLPHAEELLTSILAITPNDADALNLLGVVRAKQNRITDAERLFRRAISSSPSHVGAHINLAELLMTHDRPQDAMPVLLRAYKLAPSRPEINLNLATLFIARSNYTQAYEHLRLISRDAFNDEYFVLMLRTMIELKRTEELRELVTQFRQANSTAAETQAAFATLLIKAGFHDDALQILNAARETSQSFPILYSLGLANLAAKQYDKAEECLSSALTLKTDDVATLRALARVARAKGNLEKALSHLIQARRLAPNSPGVLYEFGATALELKLVLDALPIFERLHRDYPREAAYVYGLAAAHWTKGEVGETTRLMSNYVQLQPRSPSGWYLLGASLLRQERSIEAKAALERSLGLKIDPDTQYLLGVILEKAGNGKAATEMFRKVVQSSPNHAAAHAALGTAYREAGKYAEAQTELEQAVKLEPIDLISNFLI
jgi:Flp pilus assembly protein TadD